MKKIIAILVLAAALMAAASASAEVRVGAHQRLLQEGVRGSWTAGADSSFDSNARRLVFHVPAGSYFAVYSQRSLALNKPLLNVQNLSFEFAEARHLGAGAPRISVELAGGAILYLSAFYCNRDFGGGWGRADFSGSLHDCSIWDSAGAEYSADGNRTAIEVYEASHPDAVAQRAYLVGDEEGAYQLDRIALGAGRLYDRAFGSAKRCRSEGAC